ncbi:hypothetical protein LguiA_015337 [Lonicera macranthoides]
MSDRDSNSNAKTKRSLIFTYGTLKQGFPNYPLMQSLLTQNEAAFLGPHITDTPLPLVLGPHGVPFLLNLPSGSGRYHRVHGELYSVSDPGLQRLDELEGITLGHYERLPIRVLSADNATVVEAEAYYGHRSFAEEMWRRSGEEGFVVYTEDMGKGYVKKELRPKNRSLLDDIRFFCRGV